MDDPRQACIEAMAVERRKHYTAATPDCVCGWKNDRSGHMTKQFRVHQDGAVLDALLALREPVECTNCDGRRCMGCVTRMVHDECVEDCPDCDPGPSPLLAFLARTDPEGMREALGADDQAWRDLRQFVEHHHTEGGNADRRDTAWVIGRYMDELHPVEPQ